MQFNLIKMKNKNRTDHLNFNSDVQAYSLMHFILLSFIVAPISLFSLSIIDVSDFIAFSPPTFCILYCKKIFKEKKQNSAITIIKII